ncbi:unnamed protein product, partial [Ectocarpus fasciculatus]
APCEPLLPGSSSSLSCDNDLRVDGGVGDECGCDFGDSSDPCSEEATCTPGAEGYTCGVTTAQTETETETTGSSYLGCFSDPHAARIFTFQASSDKMTADACLALCADSVYY